LVNTGQSPEKVSSRTGDAGHGWSSIVLFVDRTMENVMQKDQVKGLIGLRLNLFSNSNKHSTPYAYGSFVNFTDAGTLVQLYQHEQN
jgi:hypothetical protein